MLAVVGAGLAAAAQIGKVPPAIAALRADLGIGLVAAGWVLSIFNVLGLLLGVGIGAASFRLGPRWLALSGLVLLALGGLAGALAPGAPALLGARLVEGMGFLMVVISGPALLAALARPADLKLVFGWWGTYMPLGQALIMAVAPPLLAWFGWRGLWIANAILVALAAPALALATRGLSRPRAAGGGAGVAGLFGEVRAMLASPRAVVPALAFASYSLQYLALTGFLPTLLGEEGLGEGPAAWATALVILANAGGNVMGGALLHQGWARSALIALASAVMAVSAIGIFALGLPLELRYGLCLVFSGVGGFIPTSLLGGAASFAPARHLVHATNGLLVQGSNLGLVIGPPAVAALAVATGGWAWSPAILATSAACAVILALVLRRWER